jgi:hypothetical protein
VHRNLEMGICGAIDESSVFPAVCPQRSVCSWVKVCSVCRMVEREQSGRSNRIMVNHTTYSISGEYDICNTANIYNREAESSSNVLLYDPSYDRNKSLRPKMGLFCTASHTSNGPLPRRWQGAQVTLNFCLAFNA